MVVGVIPSNLSGKYICFLVQLLILWCEKSVKHWHQVIDWLLIPLLLPLERKLSLINEV